MQKRFIPIIVFFALLLTGPAFATRKLEAKKTEQIPFTNRVVIVAGGSSQGQQLLTKGGILHVRDAISTGYIETNSDSPISGSVSTALSGSVNLNKMLGSFMGKWILTNENGTFEGSIIGSVKVAKVSGRFVGFGTGNFQGIKMKGSFQGMVDDYIVDITLQGILISKSYYIYLRSPSQLTGEHYVPSC